MQFLVSKILDGIKAECISAVIANSSTDGDQIHLLNAKASILNTPEKEQNFISSLSNVEDLQFLNRINIWLTNEKKSLLKSNFKSLCHLIINQADKSAATKQKSKAKHNQSNTKRAILLKHINELHDELILKNICINILAPDSSLTNLHILLSVDNFFEGFSKSDFYRLTLTQFYDAIKSNTKESFIDSEIQDSCHSLFKSHKYIFCSSVISSTLFSDLIAELFRTASKNQTSFSLSDSIKSALPICKEMFQTHELKVIEAYKNKLSSGLIAWFGDNYKKQNTSNYLIKMLKNAYYNISGEEMHSTQTSLSSSSSITLSHTPISSQDISYNKSRSHSRTTKSSDSDQNHSNEHSPLAELKAHRMKRSSDGLRSSKRKSSRKSSLSKSPSVPNIISHKENYKAKNTDNNMSYSTVSLCSSNPSSRLYLNLSSVHHSSPNINTHRELSYSTLALVHSCIDEKSREDESCHSI
jgi:hypothetical protein